MKSDQSSVQLPETILGIKLTEKEKKVLLGGKETDLIKGFTNREGHVFDAFLSLNGENKLVFRFESIPAEVAVIADNEFDAYKSQINLADFALAFGFSPDSSQSGAGTENYLLMRNAAGTGIITFRDNTSMEYRYFTLGEIGEAGSIIEFLIAFKTPLVSEIKEEIQKYHKKNQSKTHKFKLNPAVADFMEAFTTVFDLSDLTDREVFYEHSIKDATLDHAFFRGSIYNRKTAAGTVPAYPLIHSEQFSSIYTGEITKRQGHESFPLTASETGNDIWISNVINNQKIRRLVLVFDPLDALAFHQLNSRPSDLFTMFLATCGPTGNGQLSAIQEIIDRLRPEQVVLAGSRNQAGIFNNIKILGQLSEPRHFLKENNTWQDENSEIRFDLSMLPEQNDAYATLTVRLTYPDLEKGIFMNENLQKYFDHINARELAGNDDWEGQNPFTTTILNVGKHASLAKVVFPCKADLLQITEKIIIHLRPLLFFKPEYARSTSYRDDLLQATENKQAVKESKTRKVS